MTHSQQPSIDTIQKWIDKTGVKAVTEEDKYFLAGGTYYLQKAFKEIQSIPALLPQEPTTDELLEEIRAEGEDTLLEYMLMDEWKAVTTRSRYEKIFIGFGKTPREALLALKEKLSTN